MILLLIYFLTCDDQGLSMAWSESSEATVLMVNVLGGRGPSGGM